MKQEDTDWLVYHRIPPASPIAVEILAGHCGLEQSVVENSLSRLERACLIERAGQEVRMLTFGEALIKNQFKYEEDLPFVIENGVIKEKKK
ncbi:MAG TPA: MarR family transcriptional regulator [Methanoregula sp.]|nr:MarR family transcriptional regulator [Methanoregula sp.]